MDLEHEPPVERSQYERDREAWNLPQPQPTAAGPSPDEWPERELGFEEGLAALERKPAA